jgi:hypothetical protein
MNEAKVQTEIQNVINAIPRRSTRQYEIAKWMIKRLEELGIYHLMPKVGEGINNNFIGHTDAKAVIAAADDSGTTTGGFSNGEGWEHTSKPSTLYTLLNEQENSPDQTIRYNPDTNNTVKNYRNTHKRSKFRTFARAYKNFCVLNSSNLPEAISLYHQTN